MADNGDGARSDHVGEPVLIAAAVADLAFTGVGAALGRARAFLGRSDLLELAQDGREELRERGRLALRRYAPASESHLELLARRAASRPGQGDV